ncbi:PH domain-containing protein [Amphibacillus cookii]|uniref:PH domain-containing protein n=1 Tax=Amphibacillus cookii TaxID=767787 RepID=UPI001959CCE6|nr:PH domain-containing protein [Amphibacillus cookii]MBM7540329.1 putative membrane protein [Amphibacillus cookii]
MTFEPRRLHIAAIIFIFFKTMKETILLLFSLIIIFGREQFFTYLLIATIAIACSIIIYSWLNWLRFTYSLNQNELKIERGIIIRKKRTISKHRIQSIHLSQNIIHRLLGLTELQIETAGSDINVDAKLTAISIEEAHALRNQLKFDQQDQSGTETTNTYDYDYILEQQVPKYEASYKRLFAFGSTSGGFGVIISILLFGISEAELFIPDDIYQSTTAWLLTQALGTLIALSMILFILMWLLGVLGSIIKYGDFTVVRYEKELYITRGLWEKKQLSIPLNRIQAVGIKQNIIRLPFQLATVYLEVAGGEVDQSENMRTIIFPLIKKSEIQAFLTTMLPEYQYTMPDLHPVSRRLFYYQWCQLLVGLSVTLAVTLLFARPFWWINGLLLLMGSIYFYLNYRMAGAHLTKQQLTIQSMLLLSRETVFLKRDRIQALELKQSLLQKRLDIATIRASILNNFIGRHYTVSGIKQSIHSDITEWYSYRGDYSLNQVGIDLNTEKK